MSWARAIVVFDEGAARPDTPPTLRAKFADRGDVDCAEFALFLARTGLRRVSDWLADPLRRGESAARWALLVDEDGRNHSVRVGIMREEVRA